MPNAIDNFQSLYSQYRNAPAAPAQPGTMAGPSAGNVPAQNPYASAYTPDPRRSTPQPLGTQQPIGSQPQPWNNPNYPVQPGYPQPGYPQPGYPGTPPFAPTGGNDWSTQVNQGIQGVAGLVNVIGGLFK